MRTKLRSPKHKLCWKSSQGEGKKWEGEEEKLFSIRMSHVLPWSQQVAKKDETSGEISLSLLHGELERAANLVAQPLPKWPLVYWNTRGREWAQSSELRGPFRLEGPQPYMDFCCTQFLAEESLFWHQTVRQHHCSRNCWYDEWAAQR